MMLNRFIGVVAALALAASSFAGKELFAESTSWIWDPIIDLGLPFIACSVLLYALHGVALLAGILANRTLAAGAILVYVLYLLLVDVNLLQPYSYIYLIILFLTTQRSLNKSQLLWLVALFLAGVYLWSGLHKFNIQYVEHAFYNIFYDLPMFKNWSAETWTKMGYATAILEVLLGIGLVFRALRIPIAFFLVGMHMLILWALGPFGLNWNPGVWPWNMFMSFLLLVVAGNQILERFGFIKRETPTFPKQAGAVIIALSWVIPILAQTGIISPTLGWNLYAADEPYGYICLDEVPENTDLHSGLVNNGGQTRFYVNLFYVAHTNSAIMPTKSHIGNVFKSVQTQYPELVDKELKFGDYFYVWECD